MFHLYSKADLKLQLAGFKRGFLATEGVSIMNLLVLRFASIWKDVDLSLIHI